MQSPVNSTLIPLDKNRKQFLTDLYNRFGRKLYSYARHTWKVNEDDAWDLIYKTLYKVVESHKNYTFENEEKFGGFIFRIFINLLRNHYRDNKSKMEGIVSSGMELAENIAIAPGDSKEELTDHTNPKLLQLKMVLDGMEDWQRILLLMRSDGRSYADIAQYVNKPEEQLKVYYQRLKKSLTEKLYEQP